MEKIIKDLQKLVNLRSAAQVAVWLGHKDTRPVYQWLHRKDIPAARVELVKEIIKRELP